MPTLFSSRQIILVACIVLAALIFMWDLVTPMGIADGVLYCIPVLLTMWLPLRHGTSLAALGVSVLVMLGGYLSPHSEIAIWIVLVNRAISLLMIWSVAVLALRRKDVEAELRRSESSLAEAQRLAQLGNWDWDIVSNALLWSAEIYRIFGIEAEAFGATYPAFLNCVHPDDRAAVEAAVQATLQSRAPYSIVHRIRRADGVERVVHERGAVSADPDGKPVRMVGTVQDITEHWLAEQALQAAHDALEDRVAERTTNLLQANLSLEEEIGRRVQTEAALIASELRLRTVVSGAPVVMFVLDAQGVFQMSEGRGLASLGLRPGEVVGESIFTVYHDLPQVLANVRRALAGEDVATVIQVHGNWLDSRCSPLRDAQGGVSGVISVATNITELKHAEQFRLDELRAQRDTLIREVHHRIKNNLQGVIGLLRQQSNAHPELRPLLEQAISQVHSVAVVHGLHSEQSNADIMLCDMLQAISHSLNEISGDFVPLCLDLAVIKPIQVAKDEAVPIALIMNELMTNAMKHGITVGDAGSVSVCLQGDCESAQITVSNAGELQPDFSLAERRSLGTGLNLVLALLPRNGATLTICQGSGAVTARLRLAPPVICSVATDDEP